MPALIRPDLHQVRRDDPVKAGPVEAAVGVMHLAGDGGHQRDGVGLALGQRGDGSCKEGIVRPAAFDRLRRALHAILSDPGDRMVRIRP